MVCIRTFLISVCFLFCLTPVEAGWWSRLLSPHRLEPLGSPLGSGMRKAAYAHPTSADRVILTLRDDVARSESLRSLPQRAQRALLLQDARQVQRVGRMGVPTMEMFGVTTIRNSNAAIKSGQSRYLVGLEVERVQYMMSNLDALRALSSSQISSLRNQVASAYRQFRKFGWADDIHSGNVGFNILADGTPEIKFFDPVAGKILPANNSYILRYVDRFESGTKTWDDLSNTLRKVKGLDDRKRNRYGPRF